MCNVGGMDAYQVSGVENVGVTVRKVKGMKCWWFKSQTSPGNLLVLDLTRFHELCLLLVNLFFCCTHHVLTCSG